MTPDPKHYAMEAEVGRIRLSPYGFVYYAGEFLAAAKTSHRSSGFSPVPYYLVCRAIELALKGYAIGKKDTVASVKRSLGHNLIACLARANEFGLADIVHITVEETEALTKANRYYMGKGFEYFPWEAALNGYPELPDLSSLESFADRLVRTVMPVALQDSNRPV